MPFADANQRAIHFAKHGHEFGAADELQYEQMADGFLYGAMTISMRECVRPSGTHRLRVNIVNNYFGVAVVACAIIKTYYIVPTHQIVRRKGTVIKFFKYECARTDT